MKKLILIIAVLLTGCGSNEVSEVPQNLAEQRCITAKTYFAQAYYPIGIFVPFKVEQNGIEYEVLTDGNACIEAERACSEKQECGFIKYSTIN